MQTSTIFACKTNKGCWNAPKERCTSAYQKMTSTLSIQTAAQGAPLHESSQAELREPGGNTPPPELPELRSNCGTRRAKFAKLLAEQVGRP